MYGPWFYQTGYFLLLLSFSTLPQQYVAWLTYSSKWLSLCLLPMHKHFIRFYQEVIVADLMICWKKQQTVLGSTLNLMFLKWLEQKNIIPEPVNNVPSRLWGMKLGRFSVKPFKLLIVYILSFNLYPTANTTKHYISIFLVFGVIPWTSSTKGYIWCCFEVTLQAL